MSFKTLAHDVVWRNGRIATMDLGSNVAYGLLENHDMVTRENKIVAIEPKGELDTANCKVVDLEGRLITPGFRLLSAKHVNLTIQVRKRVKHCVKKAIALF